MAVTSFPFHTAPTQAFAGGLVYKAAGGDTFKMALFSAAPSLTTATYSGLSSEITGTGYTTGGQALSSLTVTATEANSWGTNWSATTWAVGSIVIPAGGNGFLYVTPNGGTSSGSAPAFPTTVGQVVTDAGGVVWSNIGEDITVFSSTSVSWSNSTLTASYAVIYDTSSGANFVMVNFGGSQSDSNGTFTVAPPSTGWAWIAGN